MATVLEECGKIRMEKRVEMKTFFHHAIVFFVVVSSLAGPPARPWQQTGDHPAGLSLKTLIDEALASPDVSWVSVAVDSVMIDDDSVKAGDGHGMQSYIAIVTVEIGSDSATLVVIPLVLDFHSVTEYGFVDTVYTKGTKK